MSNTDWQKRSIEMHRRAQKAEGELLKLNAAHKVASEHAEKARKREGYNAARHMYGAFMMDYFKRLWRS